MGVAFNSQDVDAIHQETRNRAERHVHGARILALFDTLRIAPGTASHIHTRHFLAIEMYDDAVRVIDPEAQLRDPIGLRHGKFTAYVQ